MSQYYTAILLATRDSARAIKRMQCLARKIRESDDIDVRAQLFNQYDRAMLRYHRAQKILARRPLSAADIAARQADYPRPRES